jgi:hypothetical protein
MGASPKLIEANQRIGKMLRQRSLDKYYEDPNHCLNCGEILYVKNNQKVADVRGQKFCNKSCAAQYNNKLYPKRTVGAILSCSSGDSVSRICKRCGNEFEVGRYPNGKPRWKRHCSSCVSEVRSEKSKASCKRKGTALPKAVEDMTKRELRDHYTWHLHYKTTIGRHAKKVFSLSGKEKVCQNCGFIHGIQVCHIKGIAKFTDDTTISEINNPSNLVPLCPNCHWLFDHKLLELSVITEQ